MSNLKPFNMEKIPFDIKYRKQVESGEYKVVTRDGNEVEIVKWDLENDRYPILAFIKGNGEELPLFTSKNGRNCEQQEGANDLFILTPEPKLTDFEKYLRLFVSNIVNNTAHLETIRYMYKNREEEKQVREWAKTFLTLAKQDLLMSGELMTQEQHQKLLDARIKGAQFKISDRDMESNSLDFLAKYRHDGGDYSDWDELIPTNRVMKGEEYIDLGDLSDFLGV